MKYSSRRILVYEALGFGIVLLLLWADEVFDLPHMMFGSGATPTNVGEVVLESSIVFLLATVVLVGTALLLRRMRHLEGLMHVCGSCGKVRDRDGWTTMDDYLARHSEAELHRTFCVSCILALHGHKTPDEE
ncbi:MAG: hypothetical protein AB7U23_11265 [Dehalococcoidia bacterium]